MARMKLPSNTETTKMLLDWAEAHGWSAHKRANGHLAFTHPKIQGMVFASLTPGCSRGWMRSRAIMRQKMLAAGYKPEEVR